MSGHGAFKQTELKARIGQIAKQIFIQMWSKILASF